MMRIMTGAVSWILNDIRIILCFDFVLFFCRVFLETSNTSCIIYVIKLGFSDLVLFSVFQFLAYVHVRYHPSVCRLSVVCYVRAPYSGD